MGSFSNSALTFLLGWMHGVASWVWSLIDSPQGSSALDWLGKYWLVLAIALCIAGMVIDFMVNLARWRPDLVWRSFMRRLAMKRGMQLPEEEAPVQEDYDEADTGYEQASVPAGPVMEEAQPQLEYVPQPEGEPYVRHRRAERHSNARMKEQLDRVKQILLPVDQEVTLRSYKPSGPLDDVNGKQPRRRLVPWRKPKA